MGCFVVDYMVSRSSVHLCSMNGYFFHSGFQWNQETLLCACECRSGGLSHEFSVLLVILFCCSTYFRMPELLSNITWKRTRSWSVLLLLSVLLVIVCSYLGQLWNYDPITKWGMDLGCESLLSLFMLSNWYL